MNDLSSSSRFSSRDRVVFRTTATGGIIVDLATGASFETNRVGAEVWELLSKGTTLAEVGESIGQKYGITIDEADRDVRRICRDLLEIGLIAMQSGQSSS